MLASGARTAGMFRIDGAEVGFERSWNMPGEFMAEFGSHYVAGDPRVARALSGPVGSIVSDADPELRRGMVKSGVDGLARAYDLPHTLASMFRRDSSGTWGLYLTRSGTQGAHEADQMALFGLAITHIQRAVSLRLQLAQARMHVAVADAMGGGNPPALMLVDQARRLRWADASAERLLGSSRCMGCRQGCLRLREAAAERMLGLGLQAIARGEEAGDFDLPADGVAAGYRVRILPYRTQGWVAAPGMLFLLVIARVERTGPADSLTLRQRAVLDLLVQGLSNRDIAARLSLSVNTVRNHVQAILTRLGARNRTECVALARTPQPPHPL